MKKKIKKTPEEMMAFLKKKNLQNRINQLAQKYNGKKIMIYGAGIFFKLIKENYDLSGLNIIGIADIKYNNIAELEKNPECFGYKTFSADAFPEEKPDVVLLAMLESEYAEDYFEDELFSEYGKFAYEPLVQMSFIELIKLMFFNKL